MKLFVNGFWDGFLEKTNPVHIGFFLDLFKGVFGSDIQLCSQIMESDILLESIFGSSVLGHKGWKYSFLFSGESRLVPWYKQYTCVLWGERNHDNVVNVPLFIPYLHCNGLDISVRSSDVPPKNVCAVLSNGGGRERNLFMERLERLIQIEYAGSYRTNVPIISEPYHTEGFRKAISQYKFIITMENSREDTYITEKITHGFVCGTIPIYWGSQRVGDYFNTDRFINVESVDDETVSNVANRIQYLCSHQEEWTKMVNGPVYSNERTIEMIARDIRGLIFSKPFPTLSHIYIISSPDFEPDRYQQLISLFYQEFKFSSDNVSFICPTYKHTISDNIMSQYVTNNNIQELRPTPMKKSEVSLFLNYKAVLEKIQRTYKDGTFLILESDAILGKDIHQFNDFINTIQNRQWDLIHIGMYDSRIWGSPNFHSGTGYSERIFYNNDMFIEDITSSHETFRLSRKFYTRCTDSFLWSYRGIELFLNYMNVENKYVVPFDYYMCNFFEKNTHFKHYWSENEFFKQGSNIGIFTSTIQG